MRKKSILILVVISILSLLSYLGYRITSKTIEKNIIAKQLQTIPTFGLQTLENVSFSNANLKSNISTIFIYFNSECHFCQHEAESIRDNLNSFKNVQFIFISTEEIEIIKQFSEEYNLNNQPNITFLHDKDYMFSNTFHAQSIPYILIYNKNNELVKKHKGQLNAAGILRVLDQND